ncbi:MAG TPA: ArsA-related P-loop ATPase [Acidimicrobiales bacterium]|nr:ArsA-related P-loop ATPase [Acidimicrobiales bacterium]
MTELVLSKQVIVCCGSGGVGKTTSAAAIALHGARLGRRSCVVTIDPAKRLADALGLDTLTNWPKQIDGPWSGELWALMLDTKGTFDELVRRNAATPGQASSILNNRLYRNISGALSGTQEYMAVEKLYELVNDGAPAAPGEGERVQFDLIVLDTPPTRNALDFLDAPRRLTAFLDNRIFRLLVAPTRAYLRAVSVATQTLLKTISRVVGSEVVGDAIAFFNAFEGMEKGFRDRADAVGELLGDDRTAFVLVTSPRRDAIEEAGYFADRLVDSDLGVDALIVNRLHPRFGGSDDAVSHVTAGPLSTLASNLADFRRVAEREEHHFADLAERVAPAPVQRVPFLADDVHDLGGLALIEDYLFSEAAARAS